MLAVADGSDFMGSLRNPAGWNNVYGMRPSQGRVPNWPQVDAYVSQLSTCGPMARNVLDLARCSTCRPATIRASRCRSTAAADSPTPCSPRRPTTRAFASVGWATSTATSRWRRACSRPARLPCAASRARRDGRARVAPFDADASGTRGSCWRRWIVAGRIAPYLRKPEQRALVKPEALWEVDQAEGLTGNDTMRASVVRTMFHQQMLDLFEPTTCSRCRPRRCGRSTRRALAARDRRPRDGHLPPLDGGDDLRDVRGPAVHRGAGGFGDAGLPMGLQLIGRPRADAALLRIAARYENDNSRHPRAPPAAALGARRSVPRAAA
jgi:amidase